MSLKKLKNVLNVLNELNDVVVEHEHRISLSEAELKKHSNQISNNNKTTAYLMREMEGVKRKNRDLEMRLEKQAGSSYQDIAYKFNISKSRVGQILKDN